MVKLADCEPFKTDFPSLLPRPHTSLKTVGTSRNEANSLKIEMTGGVGTPAFMSPEILERQPYGKPADIYSFAMLMYELWTEKCPYSTSEFVNPWDIAKFVVSGKVTFLFLSIFSLIHNLRGKIRDCRSQKTCLLFLRTSCNCAGTRNQPNVRVCHFFVDFSNYSQVIFPTQLSLPLSRCYRKPSVQSDAVRHVPERRCETPEK